MPLEQTTVSSALIGREFLENHAVQNDVIKNHRAQGLNEIRGAAFKKLGSTYKNKMETQ